MINCDVLSSEIVFLAYAPIIELPSSLSSSVFEDDCELKFVLTNDLSPVDAIVSYLIYS